MVAMEADILLFGSVGEMLRPWSSMVPKVPLSGWSPSLPSGFHQALLPSLNFFLLISTFPPDSTEVRVPDPLLTLGYREPLWARQRLAASPSSTYGGSTSLTGFLLVLVLLLGSVFSKYLIITLTPITGFPFVKSWLEKPNFKKVSEHCSA